MKKGHLALIIVIVLVVIAACVAYFGWPGITRETPPGAAPSASTSTSANPAASASGTVVYTNDQYGFTFDLPADWQGYTIVTSTWTGHGDEACPANGCPAVTGPELAIRNPQWTKANPWQDIPIMVFTHSEWDQVASETLAVSAAPIPPSELGEDANYVFALPARYNYAFPDGWQEVQNIIQSDPLHAF